MRWCEVVCPSVKTHSPLHNVNDSVHHHSLELRVMREERDVWRRQENSHHKQWGTRQQQSVVVLHVLHHHLLRHTRHQTLFASTFIVHTYSTYPNTKRLGVRNISIAVGMHLQNCSGHYQSELYTTAAWPSPQETITLPMIHIQKVST